MDPHAYRAGAETFVGEMGLEYYRHYATPVRGSRRHGSTQCKRASISVTEGFAFLFDRLVEDPEWLRRRLGVDIDEESAAHLRAQRLVLVRRYAAKLAYELELHGDAGRPPSAHADAYATRLSAAVGVPWPRATFLSDLDPGFYAANYLRAWALETRVRAALRTRFGPAWFDEPAAGELLRSLGRQGQRLDAAELVAQLGGGELDFAAVLEDFGTVTA